jgi:hypothetical protein
MPSADPRARAADLIDRIVNLATHDEPTSDYHPGLPPGLWDELASADVELAVLLHRLGLPRVSPPPADGYGDHLPGTGLPFTVLPRKVGGQVVCCHAPWPTETWLAEMRTLRAAVAAPPPLEWPDGLPPVGPEDVIILRALDETRPHVLTQDEIVSRSKPHVSRRTVGAHLQYLITNGLTTTPIGPKGGYAITALGTDVLKAVAKLRNP